MDRWTKSGTTKSLTVLVVVVGCYEDERMPREVQKRLREILREGGFPVV